MQRGFSFWIANLPAFLKSKVHPCDSGCLCMPQKLPSHLHTNPNNPTFLLHEPHLPLLAAAAAEMAPPPLSFSCGDDSVLGEEAAGSDNAAVD